MPTKIWIDIDVLAQLISEIGKQEDVTKYFVDRMDKSQDRADELAQEVLGKDAVIGVQKRHIREFEEKFNKMAEENADLGSGAGVMSEAIEEKNKQIDMARERISWLETEVERQAKFISECEKELYESRKIEMDSEIFIADLIRAINDMKNTMRKAIARSKGGA